VPTNSRIPLLRAGTAMRARGPVPQKLPNSLIPIILRQREELGVKPPVPGAYRQLER